MMLTVNGAPYEMADGSTLANLLADVIGNTRGSAAVVDGDVIARSTWPTYELRDGQSVDLITAVPGG